jgi:two-component system, LytTR family, sensor kinase
MTIFLFLCLAGNRFIFPKAMSHNLSNKQKWQLASTLLLLYYPVILYIDLPVYAVNGTIPPAMIFHEGITIIIIFFIFFIWITVSEKILAILFLKYSEEFFLRFNIKAQVITFIIALIMGLGFVFIAGEVLFRLNALGKTAFGWNFLVPFPESHTHDFFELYKRANIGFFLLIMLSAFYLIANRRASTRIEQAKVNAEKLEKEKSIAQLTVLRNQVNPHFLFNTLSILDSIVDEDVKTSKEFIHQLANFYRYTLETATKETVTLEVEIDFIQAYIFLLLIRFDGKLLVNFELEDDHLTKRKIAPLTLQLLIENAVKHNQMSKEKPLTIDVTSKADNVVVTNNLQLRSHREPSTQKGLQNIMDRYSLLTERPVTIEESTGHFVVSIPLLN